MSDTDILVSQTTVDVYVGNASPYATTAESAFANDNRLIRSDGVLRGVQSSIVSLGDTGDMSGVTSLTASTQVSTPIVKATTAGGLQLQASSGTLCATFGQSGSPCAVFADGAQFAGQVSVTHSGGVITQQAATQDAVQLLGRAGGTGTYAVTLTPTTLTSSQTITLQNASGTMALTSDIANMVTASSAFGTDSAVLRADGTGRGAQASLVTIDGSGNITLPAGVIAVKGTTNVLMMAGGTANGATVIGGDALNGAQMTVSGSTSGFNPGGWAFFTSNGSSATEQIRGENGGGVKISGSDPGSVSAGQVAIGGGVVRTAGDVWVGGKLQAPFGVTGTSGVAHLIGADNAADMICLELRQQRFNKTCLLLSNNQDMSGVAAIDLYNNGTQAFYLAYSGVMYTANTTDSTSKDTGSIVTEGGIGVEKDIFSGGRVRHTGCYAEIHGHDLSTAQSIATGTTYVKLTAFADNGQSANCTADATNDKITLTKAGKYRVSWNMSFSCGTNNVTWKCAAFLDGTEQNQCHAQTKIGIAGDSQHISASSILVTTANKDLDLRARHDQGGSIDITPLYLSLSVDYLGE